MSQTEQHHLILRDTGFVSVGSTVDVTLLNEHEAKIDVVVRRRFGGEVAETLAETIADHLPAVRRLGGGDPVAHARGYARMTVGQ